MDFLADAISTLSATPKRAEELILGLTDEQLSWKPGPEVFSVRENVWHLRDIDVEGYAHRIRLMLEEERPILPDVDGGKLARERSYNAQPLQPALDDLQHSRAASVKRLQRCSIQDLDREAEMQGIGTIDLRRLLNLWMEHDGGHIRDIAELRRAIDTGTGPSLRRHQAA
jgi:hypothetical protein